LVNEKIRRLAPSREVLLKRIPNSAAERDAQNGLTIKRKRGQKVTNFFTLFLIKINMAGKKGKIIQQKILSVQEPEYICTILYINYFTT
jgi:hypothetical protein